jgi:hypothetical protein
MRSLLDDLVRAMVVPTSYSSGECLVSRGFSGIKPESMIRNRSRIAQKIALPGFKRKEKR